jgi:hypothetical protein
MRERSPRSIAFAAVLLGGLSVFGLTACDETLDDASAPPESEAEAAAALTPTMVPPSPASPEQTAAALEAAGDLPLERYRYVATLTLEEQRRAGDEVSVSTTGRFVAPNRHALIYTFSLADGTHGEQRLVAIGPKVWHRPYDLRWRQTDMQDEKVVGLLRTAFSPLRSQFLAGDGLTRVREGVEDLGGSLQTVNGVQAIHYRVDAPGKDFIETFLPPEAFKTAEDLTWDLWLAEPGAWPVRIEATFTIPTKTDLLEGLGLQAPAHWRLLIEITTPNDPELMIYPPQGQ